jgi:hypothetical protein
MRLAWSTRATFRPDVCRLRSAGPEIAEIDWQPIWKQGALATTEEEFLAITEGAGMPPERLRTVKGFYDQCLTPALAETLRPRKAAVVFVDCDLYSSTVPVLAFAKPFLQPGTVIVFDDWFCFYGDPELGERRAWGEFRRANPTLRFTEFIHTNEAQAFIYLGEKQPAEWSWHHDRAAAIPLAAHPGR